MSWHNAAGNIMRRNSRVPQNRRQAQAQERVLHALSAMKRGVSISRAARENGVTPRTIKRHAEGALIQDRPGGRYRVTKDDSLLRPLQVPSKHGPVNIDVPLRTARKFANYKADVNRALAGDVNALAKWRGKKIAGIELVTDVRTLADQADKGLLPYALYRSFSGGRA
jgi:hypothetical protein